MKAVIKNISNIQPKGPTIAFSIEVDSLYADAIYKATEGVCDGLGRYLITLEKESKKRSLNANAYLWVLCDKIAKKVGASKETVYKKNVREVGVFDVVEVANGEAVAKFIDRWEHMGVGNMAEPIGSARDGYTNIVAYYGSSNYDTNEMTRLIDAVVDEAKSLGIETLTDDEILRMEASWMR